MKSIVLIGYRCSGKTAVGRELARRMKLTFIDTDEMIVESTGRTIAEMVNAGGWPLFRKHERAVLAAAGSKPAVIATGGGIIEDAENREQLLHMGVVLWLRALPEVIEQRMRSDEKTAAGRPSLSGQGNCDEIRGELARREPLYDELADHVIDTTDGSINHIAETILRLLEQEGDLYGGEHHG